VSFQQGARKCYLRFCNPFQTRTIADHGPPVGRGLSPSHYVWEWYNMIGLVGAVMDFSARVEGALPRSFIYTSRATRESRASLRLIGRRKTPLDSPILARAQAPVRLLTTRAPISVLAVTVRFFVARFRVWLPLFLNGTPGHDPSLS